MGRGLDAEKRSFKGGRGVYGCMRERMDAADWCVAAPRTVGFRFQTDNWLKVLSTPGLFLAVNGRKRGYLFLHLFIDTPQRR